MPTWIVTIGVVRGSNGSDHVLSGGLAPESTHALAGVASPTLDKGMRCKIITIDFMELSFVKTGFRATVDFIAVIEHEAAAI